MDRQFMSRSERAAVIEDLLGKDATPEAVRMMAEELPDEWTDEEWDRALEIVSRELYR